MLFDKIEGQLSMLDVVVRRIEIRDASTRLASVVRDVISETKDVAAKRASSVLQESTEVSGLKANVKGNVPHLACNLLPVLVPPLLIDTVDEAAEVARDRWVRRDPDARRGATAVDAKCSGWARQDRKDEKACRDEGTHRGRRIG
jgi:hypothetical protein